MVYLDFSKAFDSVPHKRLLIKLAAYGIEGSLLKWIENFLSGRKQRVRVGSAHSSPENVISGIPQGSILGPVLFTIYINDLPDCLASTCKVFADDTKIYNKSNEHGQIQDDLNKLQDWSNKWNLSFNTKKCKVLHFGKNNPRHSYEMWDSDSYKVLETCEEEKDLGVVFDSALSFDAHIQKAISRANQVLGLIRRAFTYIDKQMFLNLYKAMVRPLLEYGNLIWCPYLKRQSAAIERVQRRATKILPACKDMTYTERMNYLNLPSLKARRLRGDLIEMYKIYNGLTDIKLENHFTPSKSNITRNKQGKLFKNRARTNTRKFTFTNRVIDHWNNLNPNTKFATNLNNFKNLLDRNTKFLDHFYLYDN